LPKITQTLVKVEKRSDSLKLQIEVEIQARLQKIRINLVRKAVETNGVKWINESRYPKTQIRVLSVPGNHRKTYQREERQIL